MYRIERQTSNYMQLCNNFEITRPESHNTRWQQWYKKWRTIRGIIEFSRMQSNRMWIKKQSKVSVRIDQKGVLQVIKLV